MKVLSIKTSLVAATALTLTFGSCSKDFVTIQPEGQFLSENYYSDASQAYAALVGVYDPLRKNSGGFDNLITFLNAGSDDFFAGGGGPTDGAGIQAFSLHTINSQIIPGSFWNDHYQGIFRANILLSRLEGVPMDATLKARIAAEAKALRGTYYFNLIRLFGNIPLILEPLTTSSIYDAEQAPKEAIYTQIEKDLTEAITDLPATLVAATEYGRFTIPAAKAMLGKVYLYEGKNTEAAAQLADVNGTPGTVTQYGNRLVANFADLWVFTNKYNTEYILAGMHSDKSNADWGFWGSGADEGNSVNQMVGPRGYSRTAGGTAPNIPAGWSFNTLTQELYDLIKNDNRFASTVLDMTALKAAGQADYIPAHQNTGYFINKFIPRTSDIRTGGGTQELNYQQNDYIIRLADTYLMEAEALGGTGTRAQALLDAVRTRANMPVVPVSLAVIKAERRIELAGEGHRFFDLVRWGDAPAALGDRGFQANRDEVLPIPFRETQGTKLLQNPGFQ
ncbi:MAG: RagB/SusD family nutrient uptake outer membrane protein [Chitinophagaceae bacterium]|nr:MAG: RagB/SusD family nutrient uptake outer membrane protein [Chitinophagaceae bacterium]